MRNAAAVSKGGDHFVVLDGLRGVAAIFVVAHHLTRSGTDCTLFSRGYLAVDFFFMLSGFVLSHAYDHRFAAGLNWAAFMKLRLRRLWPTMAMGIMLGIVVALDQGLSLDLLAIRAIAALLFLPLPIATVHLFVLNGVQWSLFFELFANMLHAGAIYRAALMSLCRLLAVSVVLLFGVAYLHGDLAVGHVVAGWTGGFARVLAAYVGGMLLYRVSSSAGVSIRSHHALWPVAALIAALMAPAMFPVDWWWTDPLISHGGVSRGAMAWRNCRCRCANASLGFGCGRPVISALRLPPADPGTWRTARRRKRWDTKSSVRVCRRPTRSNIGVDMDASSFGLPRPVLVRSPFPHMRR